MLVCVITSGETAVLFKSYFTFYSRQVPSDWIGIFSYKFCMWLVWEMISHDDLQMLKAGVSEYSLNTVWDALGCVNNFKEMSWSFLLLSGFCLAIEKQQSRQWICPCNPIYCYVAHFSFSKHLWKKMWHLKGLLSLRKLCHLCVTSR